MTSKLEFLAHHPLFMELYEDELDALNRIAREVEFDAGAVIAYQRDLADRLYIVKEGRLFAKEVDEQGRVRDENTRAFLPGEFFGSKWLFVNGRQPATVTGTDPGRLIAIDGEDFRQFSIRFPEAVNAMEPIYDANGNWQGGLPEEAWEEATKLSVVDRRERIGPIRLLPNELVEYYSRRSVWFLLVRLFWPVAGLIILPSLFFFLIEPTTSVFSLIRIGAVVLSALLFVAIIIYRVLDWINDYFVITNKHISHREFDLRHFRTRLNKVPIEQVQSVTVDKPSLTANLFNIGTTRITTASQVGTVYFDNIDDPLHVKDVINRLRARVQELDEALAQTNMRRSMERHFQLEPGLRPADAEDGVPDDPFGPLPRTFLDSLRLLYDWRIEEDGVITYRKNRFVLLWDIAGPLLVLFLLLGILFGLQYFLSLSWSLVLAVAIPLLLADLFWLIWMYEDWRNDIFQLTDRFVIDIDRKPFGFGESRKQAPLSNIQNVSAERPGFFATVFDYGNVMIETAGAQADIVFDNVPRPSQVLSDIFGRLDDFRQRQRRQEGAARRDEYAVLLDVYRQEMEQGRIPRRTPPREQ